MCAFQDQDIVKENSKTIFLMSGKSRRRKWCRQCAHFLVPIAPYGLFPTRIRIWVIGRIKPGIYVLVSIQNAAKCQELPSGYLTKSALGWHVTIPCRFDSKIQGRPQKKQISASPALCDPFKARVREPAGEVNTSPWFWFRPAGCDHPGLPIWASDRLVSSPTHCTG